MLGGKDMSDVVISIIGITAMYIIFIVPIYFIINNIVNYLLQRYSIEESFKTNSIVLIASIILVLVYVDVSYDSSNYQVSGKL